MLEAFLPFFLLTNFSWFLADESGMVDGGIYTRGKVETELGSMPDIKGFNSMWRCVEMGPRKGCLSTMNLGERV